MKAVKQIQMANKKQLPGPLVKGLFKLTASLIQIQQKTFQ